MRKAYSNQKRLDCQTIGQVNLNLRCRDELIPILRALQFMYSQPNLRDEILRKVADDVNQQSSSEHGREGMDYWQILVLAAVRLGCNLNYDKLQDLAEQHRNLRQIMGIGDWDEQSTFSWRRIRDNVCQLKPETIDQISLSIAKAGHELVPDAPEKVRADSFVVDTNIHYPTESSLILDGVCKVIALCVLVSSELGLSGWRQHQQLLLKVRKIAREIQRISSRKGPRYKKRLKKQYRKLLKQSRYILHRAEELCETVESMDVSLEILGIIEQIKEYSKLTEQVRDTARRRVIQGESVPNSDKLFSIFEPHTQLYKRGKAGEPVQWGRLVLVCEDAAGFIVHHYVMPRDAQDSDITVSQSRVVQERLDNRVKEISFDRGFHSPENQTELPNVVPQACLPKPGVRQAAKQEATASIQFHQAKQRHPGIESTIGALQSGNGLARCRDRTELGLERYVALAVLGRNLHTLGKILIRQENETAEAAKTKRAAA